MLDNYRKLAYDVNKSSGCAFNYLIKETFLMRTVIDTERKWWSEIGQTIQCGCGTEFRGRSKLEKDGDTLKHVLDRGCPSCGDACDIRGVSSDPEIWGIS